ncbi:hypothetical protein M758_7G001800 [Ceratodon purpureus]|uniref:DYW domain-containing protein n=1 Tax=Ceratodon purpureus TaxID=3225 RepID=A0A8T0H5G3_CERPU|nr:hypothetical protein KC19_7G002000 [Ceratodon purpureus]KAG0609626.1 hypothetical protein M758_7G001800 [Ceratodon purpureus]
MDSTFYLLFKPAPAPAPALATTSTALIHSSQNHVTTLTSFTFRNFKHAFHVQRLFLGTTLLTGCQSQHSHVCFASIYDNFTGGKYDNYPLPSVSVQSSGHKIHVGYDVDEADSIECLWEKYFADPSQWWDNTITKRNYRAPDFKHKVTGEALWIFNPSTPQWVKAMPIEVTRAGRKCFGASAVRSLCGPSQFNRLPKSNGKVYPRPSSTERRRAAPVDVGKHLQKASATREKVAILKKNLQQGITIDTNIYLDILQRCFRQKDLVSAKQVHNCIKNSGMEQNPYVANYLLKVYIRCARLQDAREVFDKLAEKNVFNWTTMIGGYAEHDRARDALEVYDQMRQAGEQPNEITYLSILKACASPGGLQWGKGIHAHIKHGGFQPDVRVETALVNMYAKSGSLDDARLVFDNMVERNIITWNAMISGLAQQGCGQEAFSLFLQMQKEGFVPNPVTYLSILNSNASTGALEWVREVHTNAIKTGFAHELRVGSALIHMYAKCGSIDDARLVFYRMNERNVVTWNVMIGGLAQHGLGQEAFSLFLRMQKEGFVPDATTYLSILSASACAGALNWVKEVHIHAVKSRLASDLRVGNALVHMYAKSGSIDDARVVFDEMEDRDVVTFNAMIGGFAQHGCGQNAFSLFLQMQREGLVPDATTYVSILNVSTSTGSLEWVKEVHRHAVKACLASDLRVGSALIHMYFKSGSIDDARLVFNQMVNHDTIIWTVMIAGLAQHGYVQEALSFFLQMQREGFKPNSTTYLGILSASESEGASKWVKEVHSHAVRAGLDIDLRVGNALIHSYVKSGSIDDAQLVFNKMVGRSVTTWNSMISGFAQHGCAQKAFLLFLQMQKEGCVPNVFTYVSLLSASVADFEWVREVHRHAIKAGIASDLRVGSALIHTYAKSGSIDDARIVFNTMNERNVISWTVMIGGLAQHGRGHEALQLFEKMRANGVKPNGYSFVAVLSACSHAGLVDEGRRQFLSMTQDYGIEPTMEHYTCMVDLLGRAGHLDEAKHFVLNMPVEPSLVPWGAFLSACRSYGNLEMGVLAAKECLKLDPKDARTYVLLSNIYAAAGMWDQVSLVRSMMEGRGIHKDPGRSWIVIDNEVHYFIAGDTSHPETKEIYAVLKRLSEKLKAEGYVPDTRLVLRNFDEDAKELALCSHSEKLAIAYGLMRSPHSGKPIRVYKNLRVCSDCHTATKFISKVAGREIVAKDAYRFHHFKDGVCSCGDYW